MLKAAGRGTDARAAAVEPQMGAAESAAVGQLASLVADQVAASEQRLVERLAVMQRELLAQLARQEKELSELRLEVAGHRRQQPVDGNRSDGGAKLPPPLPVASSSEREPFLRALSDAAGSAGGDRSSTRLAARAQSPSV